MKSSLVRRRRFDAQLLAASTAGVPPIEMLEERRLFSIVLASAVSTPLSTTPTGDPAAPVIADFDGDVSFLHRPRLMARIDEAYAGRTAKISTVQYYWTSVIEYKSYS